MLTKSERPVPNGLGSVSPVLRGVRCSIRGNEGKNPAVRVRSAHNREKLNVTVFLREKVGFQPSLHGGG